MKSKISFRYMTTWILMFVFAAGVVAGGLWAASGNGFYIRGRVINLYVTAFLVIAGIAVVIFSLCMAVADRTFYNVTLIGLFSAMGGLWCMCSTDSVRIISRDIDAGAITVTGYISLYIMTIPLMCLAVRFIRKTLPAVKLMFFTSMLANTAMVIIVIVLQASGIAYIGSSVGIYHILVIFDTVLLTVTSLFRWRKAEISERFFETGIISAAAMSIAYLIYYYVSGSDSEDGFYDIVIIPMVILFMTVMFLIGYLTDLYIRIGNAPQRQQLVSLAYTDEMTGFGNRTKGEKELSGLDASDCRYLIISMDLNFLKKVNDEAGHAAGDRYIRTFASILRDVFSDADSICRMGGDEFMLVYTSNIPDADALEKKFSYMRSMEKAISGFLPDGLFVDAAYGYAYSDYVDDPDSLFMYKFADRRMYQMKAFSKKGRRN